MQNLAMGLVVGQLLLGCTGDVISGDELDTDETGEPGGGGGGAGSGADTPGMGTGGDAPLTLCTDCRIHVPTGYRADRPTPLLVALHGDEGRDFGRATATQGVIDLWRGAADQHGVIVLAIACPAEQGCNGAWSDHLAAQGYRLSSATLAWLDTQVDAVEASYNIDVTRETLAGYSGGAYWLGYAAQARAERFSGVAFVAGGMPAYTAFHGCPATALPAYFLGGDMDFRTAQMSDTANAFAGCGSAIETDLMTGTDHQATISSLGSGGASTILAWLLARPQR